MRTAATGKLALLMLCTACAAAAPVAAADRYPSKPIRIIVTGTPGGPPDLLSRWLAERLAPALGVAIVVENRPGAGGNVAMQATAHSAPDGYTLVVAGQGPFALNPHMYAKPGYNAIADFAPITQIERFCRNSSMGFNEAEGRQSIEKPASRTGLLRTKLGRCGSPAALS